MSLSDDAARRAAELRSAEQAREQGIASQWIEFERLVTEFVTTLIGQNVKPNWEYTPLLRTKKGWFVGIASPWTLYVKRDGSWTILWDSGDPDHGPTYLATSAQGLKYGHRIHGFPSYDVTRQAFVDFLAYQSR